MNNDIGPEHPLWKELRNGLFWHRTSPAEFRQILADGAIKPNDGRVNRWGGPYACQQLGGVSIFDFTTEPQAKLLDELQKWRQFLGDFKPVTVFIGLSPNSMPGQLTRYPRNKVGTTGNLIPWVEVCHHGPIPISAIASLLLLCAADLNQFRKLLTWDESAVAAATVDFQHIAERIQDEHSKKFAGMKSFDDLLRELKKGSDSK